MIMHLDNIDTVYISSSFDPCQNGVGQCNGGSTMADSSIHVQNTAFGEATMRSFSPIVSYFLVSGLVISLASGCYFKVVLYRGIVGQKLNDRPINLLLLAGGIIHHVSHLLTGISLILMIGFDVSIADVLGAAYCNIELSVGVFGIIYLSVGSLGIAIFRTLCIKGHRWTKHPKWLLGVVLSGSLGASTVISALFMVETHSGRVGYNACLGVSEFTQSILIDFMKSQGEHKEHFP